MKTKLLFLLALSFVTSQVLAREGAGESCGAGYEVQEEGSLAAQEGPFGFQSNFGGQDWQEFFSPKQGFRARFPALPARAKETFSMPKSQPSLVLETYQTFDTFKKPVKHASGYFLGVGKVPTARLPLPKHQGFLQHALEALKKSYGGSASFSLNQKGKFKGFSAREFVLTYQSAKTTYTLDGVVFLDDKSGRFFQVACLYAPAQKRLLSDCDYFFDHFQPLSVPLQPNL